MLELKQLLLAFAHDEVLAEVDGQVVAAAQVSLDVDGEEHVDLSLRTELGGERGRGDCLLQGDTALYCRNSFAVYYYNSSCRGPTKLIGG